MSDFLAGASAMGSAAIAVVFFRYWRATRDRLFLAFASAFLAFAANRCVQAASSDDGELLGVYSLRLLAFVLIIVAIVDRNRR